MDQLLLIFGLLCIGVAGFALAWPAGAWLSQVLVRFETRIKETLAEMFMFDTSPRQVTLIVVGLTVVLGAMMYLLLGIVGAFLGVGMGLGLPMIFMYLLVKRRRDRLETQLLDGLIQLANGLRAGLNLAQSMKLIEDHTEAPLSQEFGLMMREIEHGASIDRALDNASARLMSHNFRLLFAALKTTRSRGGNLPETLDRLGESLREIVRLEEKIKAQTAQGRTSAIFMGAMPVVVLGIYALIDPSGVSLMFSDGLGQVMLGLAAVITVTGFLWVRKIVSFEI